MFLPTQNVTISNFQFALGKFFFEIEVEIEVEKQHSTGFVDRKSILASLKEMSAKVIVYNTETKKIK